MSIEGDGGETAELQIGAAGRARLYRDRAAVLEAQLAATDLPRLKEKLQEAIVRFRELAASEDVLAERRERLARQEQA